MSLLPNAAARRRVSLQISGLLSTIQPGDRRVVLEDLLSEIYEEEEPLPAVRISPQTAARVAAFHGVISGEAVKLADRIAAYCQKHPTLHESYTVRETAAALLPSDKNATTKVYTAILRSSPQSDRKPPKRPRFEWLGEGNFKLFQPRAE